MPNCTGQMKSSATTFAFSIQPKQQIENKVSVQCKNLICMVWKMSILASLHLFGSILAKTQRKSSYVFNATVYKTRTSPT